MIDRGLHRDCTIVANTSTSRFILYGSKTELKINIDGQYLGSIFNDRIIKDSNVNTIGKITHQKNEFGTFTLYMNDSSVAEITENTERRSRLFHRGAPEIHEIALPDYESTYDREVEYHDSMVTLLREPTELESQWILGFTIYNLVYFGIDFTQ